MDLASWKLNEEQQADTIIYLLCQHWRVNRRQTLQGYGNAAPFDLMPTVAGTEVVRCMVAQCAPATPSGL